MMGSIPPNTNAAPDAKAADGRTSLNRTDSKELDKIRADEDSHAGSIR